MATFEFSSKHGAFVKQCCACKELTIGTRNQAESEAIFAKAYAIMGSTPDGLQPRCRKCNCARRLSIGVTHKMFEEMLRAQDNKCAICFEALANPHVDHDHATNIVRGVLCPKCNLGISFVENRDWVEAANEYLSRFSIADENAA